MKFRLIYRIIVFILLLSILGVFGISTINAAQHELVLSDGNKVYYKGTNISVMIPDEYEMPDTYFRCAWVTHLAGSIPTYSNEASYKAEINEMFDVLKYYNCNAVMFHIRIMNDALYPSKLNPLSNYIKTTKNLLAWIIEESHKRGIEFHAWMNPYRVASSGGNLSTIEKKYASYPDNPASNRNNLLMNSSGGVILNPCLQNVRDFIVNTVLEVLDNYEVDAIHFDDYFYISDVDDNAFFQNDNPNGLSHSDWRREQVNKFIKQLSDTMREYNKKNNRYVQLGISPTGIYRNGDGKVTYGENGDAISSGSKTGGQEHYASYLFSDTVHWINNEWIDYITPQSYWAFSHTVAGYADVMSWWDKVCKYKKVNLYSGMGIYMSETPGKNYSWGFDSNESVNQILYASTLENVRGTCFYSYNYLESAYKGDTSSLFGKGLKRIKNEIFVNPAILPVIRTMEAPISDVKNLISSNENNTVSISFSRNEDAKFYVVYRSEQNVTYSPEEVYKIFGSKDDVVSFVDNVENGKEYNYGIRVIGKNNALSEGKDVSFIKCKVTFVDRDGKVLSSQEVPYGGEVVAPTIPDVPGEVFVGWSRDLNNITKDLVISPKYESSKFTVTFYDYNDEVIKVEEVPYKGSATSPDHEREGYVLTGWDTSFAKVTKDIDVYPIYDIKYCKVTINDYDGRNLLSYEVKYGSSGYFPDQPSRKDYDFIGWDNDLEFISDDIVVTALYEIKKVKVTVYCSIDDSIIEVSYVPIGGTYEFPTPQEYKGFKFIRWQGDNKNLRYDTRVFAIYDEICFELEYLDINGEVYYLDEYFANDEPIYPDGPLVNGYEFIGWDVDLKTIPNYPEKIVIKPVYKKLFVEIVFYGFNDEVISKEVLNRSEDLHNLVPPTPPVIEGYAFIGWDKEVQNEFIDQEIKAKYSKKYILKFYDINDNMYLEEEYIVGLNYSLPEGKEEQDYDFVKWDIDINNLNVEDLIIDVKPVYVINYITITFMDMNNEVIKECKVNSIEEINDSLYPSIPLVEGYEFVKWESELKKEFNNQIIKAEYQKLSFTVKYLDKDNNIIHEETVFYGENAKMEVEVIDIEGFEFIGFSSDGKNIKENTEIRLEYKQIEIKDEGCKLFGYKVLSYLSLLFIVLRVSKVIRKD